MAKPVPYRVFTPANPREQLKQTIDDAPVEHAEAVLSAYRLLDQAHRSGTLELLRGALSAQDAVINHVVDMVSQPEMVRALRNLLVLGKLLGNIDPETLEAAVSGQGSDGWPQAPPTLFSLLGRANTGDARRGLNIATGLLSALGAAAARQPK